VLKERENKKFGGKPWPDIRDGFEENGQQIEGVLKDWKYQRAEWFTDLRLNRDDLKTIRKYREEFLLKRPDDDNE
jgi:hypothetical protein